MRVTGLEHDPRARACSDDPIEQAVMTPVAKREHESARKAEERRLGGGRMFAGRLAVDGGYSHACSLTRR